MTNAHHIAAILGGRRARHLLDGGYLTCCPVPSHGKGRGDRDPSLRISNGEHQLLVYCYAGCNPALILGELRHRGLLDGAAAQPRDKDAEEENRPGPNNKKPAAIAAYMWRQSRPITGTIAEIYLREARRITCSLPSALRFLPAHKTYPPAMIAAFGLTLDHVTAVHLTRLKPDGSGKIDDVEGIPSKLMIGPVLGRPIVLAEPNDLLGLAISEGIEDGLSIHQSTGLGVWAAGSATHMPDLAVIMPDYIEVVTIYADADKAGEDNTNALALALCQRQPRPGERPIEVVIEGLT